MTKRLVSKLFVTELERAVNLHTDQTIPKGWDWEDDKFETDYDWILSQAAFLLNRLLPKQLVSMSQGQKHSGFAFKGKLLDRYGNPLLRVKSDC